jgi:hypothetical protein
MSRIRQIKPSWFTDKALQTGLKSDDREFYIALWQLADDDGWFEWDPDAIGVFVYGFLGLSRREVLVERHSRALQSLTPEAPHLVIHLCGHAEVPKMAQHQRVSDAKRITSDHRRHTEGKCPIPAGRRGTPRGAANPPASPSRNGTGKGNGRELVDAREAQEPTEFGARVGPFGDILAGKA